MSRSDEGCQSWPFFLSKHIQSGVGKSKYIYNGSCLFLIQNKKLRTVDSEHRMNGVKNGNHKSGIREHINNLDFNVERNSESYKYVVRMSNAWFSYVCVEGH